MTPVTEITVGELAARVRGVPRRPALARPARPLGALRRGRCSPRTSRTSSPGELAFGLDVRADERGDLAELLREPHAGQIFVSRTHPGITRGNHYHDTKVERFMVVEGDGLVRLRPLGERRGAGVPGERRRRRRP